MSDAGIYFETFAAAIDGIIRAADESRALLTRPSEVWSMVQEPLFYGQTRQGNFALELLRDRPTKKFFHASVYRLETGRYELTTYIL
jgi:hypothetical protein